MKSQMQILRFFYLVGQIFRLQIFHIIISSTSVVLELFSYHFMNMNERKFSATNIFLVLLEHISKCWTAVQISLPLLGL